MNTPDTTEARTEQDEALLKALTWHLPEFNADGHIDPTPLAEALLDNIAPQLAAIRRHAVAEALKQQAAKLRQVNRNYLKQLQGYSHTSDAYKLTYARGQQATTDARRLDNAAQDIIAEGWEFTCYATWAATRDDPGYGCDTPVESEGDYCDRHEPADDDRDAD